MVLVGMKMLKTAEQAAIGRFAGPRVFVRIGLALVNIIITEGRMKLL